MKKELLKTAPFIARVVNGKDLTEKEAFEAFRNIFLYDKNGYYFAALIAAIHAKGEMSDELLGLIRAHQDLGVNWNFGNENTFITDLSGSGGSKIKTINISTAASFLVAAAGFKVLKSSYWAVTGLTGSADIFEAFGISLKNLMEDQIKEMLFEVGIVPIFYPFISPNLTNRGRLSHLIFKENQLKIHTPFHLVTNLISPVKMHYRIYGLYDKKYLRVVARLLSKLGFKKSLVFSAEGGFAEISNFGQTFIVEQDGKNLKEYVLTPEDLGIKRRKIDELITSSRKENIRLFIQVLLNKAPKQFSDLVAINAAASFYVLGRVKNLSDGVKLAQKLIKKKEGFGILKKLVKRYGDHEQLGYWLSKA